VCGLFTECLDGGGVRLNYVLWIQDLLDSTGNPENDEFEPTREVVGLDVYAVFAS